MRAPDVFWTCGCRATSVKEHPGLLERPRGAAREHRFRRRSVPGCGRDMDPLTGMGAALAARGPRPSGLRECHPAPPRLPQRTVADSDHVLRLSSPPRVSVRRDARSRLPRAPSRPALDAGEIIPNRRLMTDSSPSWSRRSRRFSGESATPSQCPPLRANKGGSHRRSNRARRATGRADLVRGHRCTGTARIVHAIGDALLPHSQ